MLDSSGGLFGELVRLAEADGMVGHAPSARGGCYQCTVMGLGLPVHCNGLGLTVHCNGVGVTSAL